MANGKYLHVKCYLFPSDVEPCGDDIELANEIRRFPLANNPLLSIYAMLVKSLSRAYKDFFGPDEPPLRTFWLDENDELVMFSTDREMLDAVQKSRKMIVNEDHNFSNGSGEKNNESGRVPKTKFGDLDFVFRVYAAKQTSIKYEDVTDYEEEDEGVVYEKEVDRSRSKCNHCNTNLLHTDLGFECTICKNYNLCQTCRLNGIHLEHIFVKIVRK
jgi:hypothetical protein